MAVGPWDHLQAEMYEHLGLNDDYTVVSGTFALPIAEEPPTDTATLAEWSPVAIVKAHADYRLRTVSYEMTKKNNPPVIPKPESVGNMVFLGGTLSFPNPVLNQGLVAHDWTAAGNLIFVENNRSDPSDGFILTTPPFTTTSQDSNFAIYSEPLAPELGAVSEGGLDAKIGALLNETLDYNDPVFYIYSSTGLYPGYAFNPSMVNGDFETELPTS